MSDRAVTDIQPQDTLLLIVIKRRSLTEQVTSQLVDDVHSAAASHPALPIVMDMSQVKFAPSVSLGSLVQLSKSFEFDGRQLALVGVDHNVRDAMHVTHLDKMFNIHRTVEDFTASQNN